MNTLNFNFTSAKLSKYLEFCSDNKVVPDKYDESHHVYPRAIFGDNDQTVYLSPYNHLKAHYLLLDALRECGSKDEISKMAHALFWMCNTKEVDESNLDEFAHIYEYASIAKRDSLSGGDNPSAVPIIVDGLEYGCMRDATKATGISYQNLRKYNSEYSSDTAVHEFEYDLSKRSKEVRKTLHATIIEIDGVVYPSILDVAQTHNIKKSMIYKIIKRYSNYQGDKSFKEWLDLEKENNNQSRLKSSSKSVVVDCIVYSSISKAAIANNTDNRLIKKYVEDGIVTSFDEWLTQYKKQCDINSLAARKLKGKSVTIDGVSYSSISDAKKILNIDGSTIKRYLIAREMYPNITMSEYRAKARTILKTK